MINPADYPKVAIDAVSYDGKQFAVPIALEAVALIYNKKMVPEAPKNWDDFVRVAKEKGFAFDARGFFFSYGFLGGSGAYVFKNNGGSLDPKDVGLANDGAKAGLQLLHDMVHTQKFFPADVNYEYAQGRFIQGKTGMLINGPWAIADIQNANIEVGVAPMPTLPNGKPFNPFVGVQSGFVASASRNQEVAWDFVKFMQENAPPVLYKAGKRIPAALKHQQAADVKADAVVQGFIASAANGTPMPNIPAMQQVWGPAGDMIGLVLDKKVSPAQAAADALKKINDGVAAMK